MPPRAALYARVSTTNHGQDVGLQLDALRRLAETRGWSPVEVYVDEGVSGAKDSRPALDRMMADALGCQTPVLVGDLAVVLQHDVRGWRGGRDRPTTLDNGLLGAPAR